MKANFQKKFVVLLFMSAFLFCFIGSANSGNTEIQLSLATYAPPVGPHYVALKHYADGVEKGSNGRVKIKIYWGQTLAKSAEILDAVRLGAADMGHYVSIYFPKHIPFAAGNITTNIGKPRPFYDGISTKGYRAYRQVCKEFPIVEKEFDSQNQVLLGLFAYYEEYFIMKKKITQVDGFRGQKIRSYGAILPSFYKAIGAVPVSITSTDAYDGLIRGVVDGAICSIDTAYKYKYYEPAKFLIDVTSIMGAAPFRFPITINKDKLAKLPPDVKELLAKSAEDSMLIFDKESMKLLKSQLKEMEEKGGVNLIKLPENEIKVWQEKAKGIFLESYLKLLKSSGYKGDDALKAIERFGELTD